LPRDAGHSFAQIDRPLPTRTFVKNTFLELAEEEDEDPWFVTPTPLRQKTDSLLDRSSHSLQLELGRQGLFDTATQPVPGPPDLPVPLPDTPLAGPVGGGLTSGVGPVCVSPVVGKPRTLADLIPGDVGLPSGPVPRCLQRRVPSGSLEESLEEVPEPAASSCSRQDHAHHGHHVEEEDEEEEDSSEEPCSELELPAAAAEAVLQTEEAEEEPLLTAALLNGDKASSREVQSAREVALRGGGLSGYSTVMLRDIPSGYSQRKLMREINSLGFLGKYDFLYLPMDPRSKASRGFAFVNFVAPAVAEAFYHKVHGQRLKHFRSEKCVSAVPADVQGFEENAAHFAALQGGKRKRRMPHNRPIFFRKLPAELEDEVAPPAVMEASQYAWPPALPAVPMGGQPQARFCGYCGMPKQAQYLFCPYCGGRALV